MDINLEEYEAQLVAVEKALNGVNNANEKAELETLKESLLELLELTRQTAGTERTSQENENAFDDEMQRFISEIGQLEESTQEVKTDEPQAGVACAPNSLELKKLKAKLKDMVGHKCSAPHQHTWGAVTYHNAIVCGIADTAEVDEDGGLDVRLRVLFTNPTHREMLPCSYFLEGECRFDEAKCHYSHGELVQMDELRDYSEPNFELLGRNCIVLAKLKDRIWHRGRVLCANFVEKSCRVRLENQDQKNCEQDFAFEDLLPIFQDDDVSESTSSDSDDESDSEEFDDFEMARQRALVEKNLFTFQSTQPLGEWEKYTRGIGSKLMAKMGYVHGTGLGEGGRGIVTPISAQILPQGRSLDHCMELREAANGDKDLFSVEKKLKRDQKKQTALNVKAYEREAQRTDVFSFLNDNVLANSSGNNVDTIGGTRKEKCALRDQTTKSLNVESMRIADDIRRKEREICKVQESIQRNAEETEVRKRLQTQLVAKTRELNALQREEKCLSKEQATRRAKDKLFVF